MKIVLCIVLLWGVSACSTPTPERENATAVLGGSAHAKLTVTKVSEDPEYGYTSEKPIKVGGVEQGPGNQRAYLSSLRGPQGEPVRFARSGSCCPFKTDKGFMGSGMLDRYQVWIGSATEPKILYLNMYDYEEPLVPAGFSAIAL